MAILEAVCYFTTITKIQYL